MLITRIIIKTIILFTLSFPILKRHRSDATLPITRSRARMANWLPEFNQMERHFPPKGITQAEPIHLQLPFKLIIITTPDVLWATERLPFHEVAHSWWRRRRWWWWWWWWRWRWRWRWRRQWRWWWWCLCWQRCLKIWMLWKRQFRSGEGTACDILFWTSSSHPYRNTQPL